MRPRRHAQARCSPWPHGFPQLAPPQDVRPHGRPVVYLTMRRHMRVHTRTRTGARLHAHVHTRHATGAHSTHSRRRSHPGLIPVPRGSSASPLSPLCRCPATPRGPSLNVSGNPSSPCENNSTRATVTRSRSCRPRGTACPPPASNSGMLKQQNNLRSGPEGLFVKITRKQTFWLPDQGSLTEHQTRSLERASLCQLIAPVEMPSPGPEASTAAPAHTCLRMGRARSRT